MDAGEVYAVSNKCTHLGLPLQGKIVGKEVVDGCIVCPFHNNAFDVKTGEVQGEWAPGAALTLPCTPLRPATRVTAAASSDSGECSRDKGAPCPAETRLNFGSQRKQCIVAASRARSRSSECATAWMSRPGMAPVGVLRVCMHACMYIRVVTSPPAERGRAACRVPPAAAGRQTEGDGPAADVRDPGRRRIRRGRRLAASSSSNVHATRPPPGVAPLRLSGRSPVGACLSSEAPHALLSPSDLLLPAGPADALVTA